jgi:hypothetical protein
MNTTQEATMNARDIQEMMAAWDKIVSAARTQFPEADAETLFQIASGAMNHAIGIK